MIDPSGNQNLPLLNKLLAKLLLFFYHHVRKSTYIRFLIKKLLKKNAIKIVYKGVAIKASTNSAIESMLLFKEYNEDMLLDIIRFYSQQQFNFVDIGANIGLHSLIAATSNPDIKIYSFEPEPANFHNFLENILLNNSKNIKPFMIGVGNTSENKYLNINNEWNKGKHSIKNSFSETNEKIIIPISTLDNFSVNFLDSNLFIKIDVEGYEREVVEGARQTLQALKNGIISIELIDGNIDITTCKNIIKDLTSFGFDKVYLLKRRQIIEVNDFKESGDYLLLKGRLTKNNFVNFLN